MCKMNLSDSNQIVNFYEQMLLQRNIAVKNQLQHNESLHLQILNKSSSSNSSASSTSSLLSISSKSQQASPNNSLVSEKSESPESKPKANDYETNYQAYMINAAAAAAAAAAFPYSIFNNLNSSTPILNHSKSFPHQHHNFMYANNQISHNKTQTQTSSQSAHHQHHHYHHSNQNIYRPNGKSEEAKPTHSYIGLIALAILSAPEKKLVLSDIYQWILDNYTYFHTRGSGWRNSIRHNLSLNDCFMKSGRSSNGKGHYWTIHPANMEDFMKGDFRRRRAQRRVRKSLGLTVPEEDEEDDDILTPPSSLSPVQQKYNLPNNNNVNNNSNNNIINNQMPGHQMANSSFFYDKNKFNFYNFQSNFCAIKRSHLDDDKECPSKRAKNFDNENISEIESVSEEVSEVDETDNIKANNSYIDTKQNQSSKKRSFNVDSLLAPDCEISPKKIRTDLVETENELNSSTESYKNMRQLNDATDSDSKLNKFNKKSSDESSSRLDTSNDDVEQWKQTFSKIMARSYKNNNTQSNHSIGGLIKK